MLGLKFDTPALSMFADQGISWTLVKSRAGLLALQVCILGAPLIAIIIIIITSVVGPR